MEERHENDEFKREHGQKEREATVDSGVVSQFAHSSSVDDFSGNSVRTLVGPLIATERAEALMNTHLQRSRNSVRAFGLMALFVSVVFTALGSTQSFSVPDDLAFRIRLDDTLTSTESQIGDPFSATVVDKGDYQNARVYGHIAQIDISGKIKGNTSMMLRFDRLIMPDGRRASIHAEILELYHAPSGEKVDVEGAIESGGRGRKTITHTVIGAGAGALLGGIFGGGKGAGIGSVIGGAGGLGTTAFRGRQKITLSSGQEMLIRITAH